MILLKLLRKYFIPHRENDYKPHFFREASVLTISFVIIFFFLVALLQGFILTRTEFFSAIVPSVLVDLANQNREENKLPTLFINPVLQEVARAKANDMAKNEYFAHTSPEGITPWHWFREAGYTFSFAGENLAVNFSDSFDVTQAWMVSPLHRANILNLNFTEIGIATAKGMYRGRETTFVVQVFGKPAPAPAKPLALSNSPESANTSLESKEEVKSTEGTVSAAPSDGASLAPLGRGETLEKNDSLKTLVGDDMFVAVQNLDQASLQEPEAKTPVTYASWLSKVLSSPKTMLTYFYVFLAVLILIALILMVFVEIRQQHPLHILYGFFLLLLIGALVYSEKAILLSQVLVI